MTDKQRLAKLNSAIASLKKTEKGYAPEGVYWKPAIKALHELQLDLALPPPKPVPKVPLLGPICAGGQSVLLHDLTHATDGLPGYPAYDDGFIDGLAVLAPEACVVTRQSGSQGGDAFYLQGLSKLEYWIGHVAVAPATGKRFLKGQTMARIARITVGGGSHVHLGINATPLIGHELLHRLNYTHGAPTVGAQLARALNT